MRNITRKLTGAAAGVALMAGAVAPAPAIAGTFGDDIEEILIGAAVLAGVIAVASEVFGDTVRDRSSGRQTGRGDRADAIDECMRRAEREAERYGRNARARDTDVDRDGREYRVKGEVEVERDGSWNRDRRDYERARFTCTARDGRVSAFRFTDGFNYAYRY